MAAETFMLAALILSAVAFLANILLWIPIFGKVFWLLGKILRIVGIAVGLIDVWAILAYFEILAPPF